MDISGVGLMSSASTSAAGAPLSSSSAASTNSSTLTSACSTTLPTTTTFLPILDDLLSPDFRPVTHPPIATPLQTPTTPAPVPTVQGQRDGGIPAAARSDVAGNPASPLVAKHTSSSSSTSSNSSFNNLRNTTNNTNSSGVRGLEHPDLANQNGSPGSSVGAETPDDLAAAKIQKWWRGGGGGGGGGSGVRPTAQGNKKHPNQLQPSKKNAGPGVVEERVKHSIRHKRAEEHIRHLETEVHRLKSSLTAERKLRSLQFEAIRSLWSQVQKLSVNNPRMLDLSTASSGSNVMSQSLPNGLPNNNPTTTAATACPPGTTQEQPTHQCVCSSEIAGLKQKIEAEVGELRGLVGKLVEMRCGDVGSFQVQVTTASSNTNDQDSEELGASGNGSKSGCTTKRPDTLNLTSSSGGGASNNGGGSNKPAHQHDPEELQGYADDMARFVVERGISDNTSEQEQQQVQQRDGMGAAEENQEEKERE